MNTQCKHNVPTDLPCPWCGRAKAEKETQLRSVKKPFQLYQALFQNFIQEIAPRVQFPLCVALIVEDINEEVFVLTEGPVEKVLELNKSMYEHFKKEIEREGLNA